MKRFTGYGLLVIIALFLVVVLYCILGACGVWAEEGVPPAVPPRVLNAGTDYLAPTGDGSGLTGVVHTETDPRIGVTSVVEGSLFRWNASTQKLEPVTGVTTSPTGDVYVSGAARFGGAVAIGTPGAARTAVEPGGVTVFGTSGASKFMVDGAGNITTEGGLNMTLGKKILWSNNTGIGQTAANYLSLYAGNADIPALQIYTSTVGVGDRAIVWSPYIGAAGTAQVKVNSGATTFVFSSDGSGAAQIKSTGGIRVGTDSWISGTSSFVSFGSGVSPVGSMTSGAVIYCRDGQLWANGTAGDHTQLTPHDPETGEIYTHSFNVYSGIGVKYYPQTNRTITYTIPKVNPEAAYKADWVKQYIVKNTLSVPSVDGKAPAIIVPTVQEAEMAAEAQCKFNWATMPKTVRDAWNVTLQEATK